MRMERKLLGCLLALGLLGGSGCQRLNDERTVTFDDNNISSITYDGPIWMSEKVSVHVSSPGAPVTVYLVLEKDYAATEAAVRNEEKGKPPTAFLDKKENIEDGSVEGTVPAKSKFAIIVKNELGKK